MTGFSTFLLTSETGVKSIGRQLERVVPNAVQLIMPVEQQTYDILRTKYPFAVDVCTGVRTNGRLDKHKLAVFMKIALS